MPFAVSSATINGSALTIKTSLAPDHPGYLLGVGDTVTITQADKQATLYVTGSGAAVSDNGRSCDIHGDL